MNTSYESERAGRAKNEPDQAPRKRPMFATPEERKQITVVAAAVPMHGILAGGAVVSLNNPAARAPLIKTAFDLAEEFMAEVDRRLGP